MSEKSEWGQRSSTGVPLNIPRQPASSSAPEPIEIPRGHVLASLGKRVSNRRTFEGPRGASTRASVWLRYLGYFLTIMLCSGITQSCFAGVTGATSGGEWMLLSASFQLVIAAIGSFMFANRRVEIGHQMRSYVFGYTVLPGTGMAIFMWAARHLSSGPTGSDVFVNSLNSALPWLYFLPIIIPAVIFLKTVAGMRVLNRVQLDDQEIMKTYTRNDGRQR